MKEEMELRRTTIKKFISNKKDFTQDEIVSYLEGMNIYTSQATVQRDLKCMGYAKTPTGYIKRKTVSNEEDIKLLRALLASEDVRIMKDQSKFHMLVIRTKNGKERAISDMISAIYGDKISGVFAGSDCVMIITTSEKNFKSMVKTLKEFKVSMIE